MSNSDSTRCLVELAKVISDSVSELQSICQDQGLTFPSLDDHYTAESEVFRRDRAVSEAADRIAAAANQLLATVLPPFTAVYAQAASGHNKSACLRVCLEAHVAEILRVAGPEGLHARDIAEFTKLCPKKLARILRVLAIHHIFKEVSPDVFANTRISSVLDTGKSIEEIMADPGAKHDDTSGFPALVSTHLDDIAKGSAYLWENLSDPLTGYSERSTESAFSRALGIDVPPWEFLEQPDQAHRLRRFGSAMRGLQSLESPSASLDALWDDLPQGSVVVDVGGGVGASSLALALAYPHLHVVLQDRPPVIEQGAKIFAAELPQALAEGRVTLQAHDFFDDQPVKNAAVFLLKQILHDWSDEPAVKILARLRDAALPTTKLVIVDCIMQYACSADLKGDDPVFGSSECPTREASSLLLGNSGIVNVMSYCYDMTMLTRFNAQERTLKHLSEILEQGGWKLEQPPSISSSTGFLQPVVAIPLPT